MTASVALIKALGGGWDDFEPSVRRWILLPSSHLAQPESACQGFRKT